MVWPEAVSRSLSARTQPRPVSIPKAGGNTCADAQVQGLCNTDYRNQARGRETGNGRPFAIPPAGAPSSFIDHLQQLDLRPEGLITPTLVQPMPPDDHNALQAAGRDMLPTEGDCAGLVALSRHRIFRSLRPRFPAASSRCSAGLAVQNRRLRGAQPAAGTAAGLPVYPSPDAEAESGSRWTAWS